MLTKIYLKVISDTEYFTVHLLRKRMFRPMTGSAFYILALADLLGNLLHWVIPASRLYPERLHLSECINRSINVIFL